MDDAAPRQGRRKNRLMRLQPVRNPTTKPAAPATQAIIARPLDLIPVPAFSPCGRSMIRHHLTDISILGYVTADATRPPSASAPVPSAGGRYRRRLDIGRIGGAGIVDITPSMIPLEKSASAMARAEQVIERPANLQGWPVQETAGAGQIRPQLADRRGQAGLDRLSVMIIDRSDRYPRSKVPLRKCQVKPRDLKTKIVFSRVGTTGLPRKKTSRPVQVDAGQMQVNRCRPSARGCARRRVAPSRYLTARRYRSSPND